jgi:hypothetical protein
METQVELLRTRLNKIKERVTAPSFLANEGIGNEIGFYVFDYPSRYELEVREHITMLLSALNKEQRSTKYAHINLFNVVIDYLKSRNLLDDVIELERSSGTQELLTAFEDLLAADQICNFIVESTDIGSADCTFVSGIGSCWPFLRAHTIFNNLQNYVGNKPVILFYPGHYSGQDLKPFDLPTLKANYYRAFALIEKGSIV